jgi:hypothetical protein
MGELVFILIGAGIFFLVIFLLRKRKKKQVVFPIKKVTSCKDEDCTTKYQIQGINKDFTTFEDAKTFAETLK